MPPNEPLRLLAQGGVLGSAQTPDDVPFARQVIARAAQAAAAAQDAAAEPKSGGH